MSEFPWTPDFDHWPVDDHACSVSHNEKAMSVTWSDGSVSQYHALLLRENIPQAHTIHPKAREMSISPAMIDDDLIIRTTSVQENGAVLVAFSDDTQSAFHPGWLRGIAYEGDEVDGNIVLWRGSEKSEPPTFNGPAVLENPALFLQWLEGLRDYGVARLRGLPQVDGLLSDVVNRIGPIRESNFGRSYTLEIKEDPDSQAFTSDMLLQHIDLPTRECPHGLQFLYTRENTTKGGEGVYVDAYRIAEDLRLEEQEHYFSLTKDIWEYNNRAKNSDYRAKGPVIETDSCGRVCGIRYNTFLRAPLKAPLHVQERAYKAYRAFCARAQDASNMMIFRYEPGDLLAFDNRRVLHGRAGYDAKGGSRYIEGMYADRDDLYSTIRTIKRQLAQEKKA